MGRCWHRLEPVTTLRGRENIMQPLGEIQKFPLRPVRWRKSLLQLIHFITILPHTVTIHLRFCHMLYVFFLLLVVLLCLMTFICIKSYVELTAAHSDYTHIF